MKDLKPVAREALDAFGAIAKSAGGRILDRGLSLDDLASVNQATAETITRDMREMNEQRISDAQRLRREPAIARLVLVDEDENRETLYISPVGTVGGCGIQMCSYMSPKGELAPLAVGEGKDVRLPGGVRWFDVVEKMTFKTVELAGEWDSRPAIHFREKQAPLTIKSLRELLLKDGFTEETADAVEAWLNKGEGPSLSGNVSEGIVHQTLTAMQLRVAPILDRFQDEIFRLPIDSQIAVMGPPGTGKTTTMVRRLRQKIDFNFLDEDERRLVEVAGAPVLEHPDSWILFTPTELLRLYVKEALGKEGVPVHDERLRTWEDYRWSVARNDLRILRRGNRGGLVMQRPAVDSSLNRDTLLNQAGWFEAFEGWQAGDFVQQLQAEADRLLNSGDEGVTRLGRRVADAIARSESDVLRMLAELASMRGDLLALAGRLGDGTRGALDQPLRRFAAGDSEFLDALAAMVSELLREESDEADDEADDDDADEDADGETDETRQTLRGRRLVAETFHRAMRTLAMRQAVGRKPAERSRAGRILSFLGDRGLEAPNLKETGQTLLLQRAAGRLAGAPANYLRRYPLRYRRFRRAMREEGSWYGPAAGGASQVHPAEVDLIMLGMLRAAAAFESDRLLSTRLAERRPPMLDAIARLRRTQVLVDEATDFSPVQLACMAALANPETKSLFLSGDFNQRLTRWGTRTEGELNWVAPALDVRPISVSYRQSRKLAGFARTLARLQGTETDERAPDYSENIGFDPVLGTSLATDAGRARWLTDRIREIEAIVEGELPTIAVLVPDEQHLALLTEALNEALADLSLQAKAYAKGESIGQSNDVRVFPVEYIKGLEFEAVFFLDVDQLAARDPELFDRYVYVGATRAATFLGLTCRGADLPPGLEHADLSYGQNW